MKSSAINAILFLVMATTIAHAQRIENPFALISGERSFIYGLDNRRTHINGEHAVIYGLYSGIGFSEKKLRLKLGISGSPFEIGKTKDISGNLKFSRFMFASIGEEIDFWKKNNLKISTYFQLGAGVNYFRLFEPISNTEIAKGRQLMVPLETGLQAGYDLLNWLSIKAGGGWRFVFPEASGDLSGYYIKAGLQIDPREFMCMYMLWHQKRKSKLR